MFRIEFSMSVLVLLSQKTNGRSWNRPYDFFEQGTVFWTLGHQNFSFFRSRYYFLNYACRYFLFFPFFESHDHQIEKNYFIIWKIEKNKKNTEKLWQIKKPEETTRKKGAHLSRQSSGPVLGCRLLIDRWTNTNEN